MHTLPVPPLDTQRLARPVREEITVLIPTLGRAILKTALEWHMAGSAWPSELIVVDQGSNPEVEQWLAKLHAAGLRSRYIPSTERGRAKGVNRGMERATTHFVAVTDDDCFVAPDWLEKMNASLHAHPDSILTGRVEPEGNEKVMALVTSPDPAVYDKPLLKQDIMAGGNMGVSMAIIERIGRYNEDPRMRCAEDVEWAYRALRAGVPIRYAPEVVVRHVGWRTQEQRNAQYRAYARSHGAFYGTYLRRGDGFIALRVAVHLARAMRRWVRGVLSGNQEEAIDGRAYVLDLIPGVVAGLRNGRQP